MSVSLVLLSAGSSSRFQKDVKKQWLRIKNDPLWVFVLKRFKKLYDFESIIITGHKDEISYMNKFIYDDSIIVAGGDTRSASLKNALEFVDSNYVMVSDIARCCIDDGLIKDLIMQIDKYDLVAPYINAIDTTLCKDEYLDRDDLKLLQTPQISKTHLLKSYLEKSEKYGDESSLFKANNANIGYIKGSSKFLKLTTKEDLSKIPCLKKPSKEHFVGIGYDLHQLEDKGISILGGVVVSKSLGIKAHSDGDVLIHSIIDAILGAIGGGDIGEYFPDTDDRFRDISSMILLEYIYDFMTKVGYKIINIDATIIVQNIKISPFKKEIQLSLSKTMKINPSQINIKATTSEKIGSLGRGEGIAVLSTANLKFINWKK